MSLVFIDAGHGGHDSGCNYQTLQERDITLNYSQRLSRYLEYMGHTVKETRTTDKYLSLPERCNIVNINPPNNNVFVSIHVNSCDEENTARGFEVFHYRGSQNGFKLANSIANYWSGMPTRGIKEAGYYVLKNTNCPAALVEIGFINHVLDREKMLDIFWSEERIREIARGIDAYFTG